MDMHLLTRDRERDVIRGPNPAAGNVRAWGKDIKEGAIIAVVCTLVRDTCSTDGNGGGLRGGRVPLNIVVGASALDSTVSIFRAGNPGYLQQRHK